MLAKRVLERTKADGSKETAEIASPALDWPGKTFAKVRAYVYDYSQGNKHQQTQNH